MSLALRVLPFCANSTDVLCMTEPWEPRDNGFIWFLNFILAFVFPIIPWEIFFFIPWGLMYLADRTLKDPKVEKGTIAHLILFINLFAGIYGGGAHPAGLIQAFASLGGAEGICVVHPPPNALGALGPPFKLYYGFKQDSWCTLLALHVVFMCLVGWYFIFIIVKDRKAAKAAGKKGLLKSLMAPSPAPSTFYGRAALFMFVGGCSQAAPYVGTFGSGYFGSLMGSTGGYSKRPFSPAITENLSAWSWIIGGIVFAVKFKMAKDKTTILPATA